MKYTPLPVTDKIVELKKEYLSTPVATEDNPYIDKKYKHFCTGDRWITLGFLEGWLAHEDAPTARRRRSYAEAAELYAAQPIILDHELIVGQPYLPRYTEDEQKKYDDLCERFRMSNLTLLEQGARIDHLALDYDKIINVGIVQVLKDIDEAESMLDLNDSNVYPDFEVIKKFDFYECCKIELTALLDLAKRYSNYAAQLAGEAKTERARELRKISDALKNVPAYPAKDFYEAIQSVQFVVGTLFGLYPLGRPDQYLYPLFKRDIDEGILSVQDAQDYIDNFCLSLSSRVFSRAACGFIVGGQNAEGQLIENELTYMFITALDHIHMPDPNGALAVNEKTSDDILRYAQEVLSHATTHPAFYNDNAIIDSLVNYGCTRKDAVKYIHTTCAEISIAGKSRSHTTPYQLALPKILTETIQNCSEESTFEEIKKRYIEAIAQTLKDDAFEYLMKMLEASRNGNEPMRVCCFVDDCIARGKSIYEGGERYTFIQPILVGFSTTVDALMAIKKIVFDTKMRSLKEFCTTVENDYKNEEAFRQFIINKIPHYGNDNAEVDNIAAWLASEIKSIFKNGEMLAKPLMMPGTFSYINHAKLGEIDGASFDGRHAFTSYSDGCSAAQGRDTNGPTAMINSLTSWDQSAFLAGMVVNIKFNPNNLKTEYSEAFISLLRTFIERGGLELQVNVVCRQELEDACIHPEKHRDLIVRIGGFSDYFVRLTDTLKAEIIERTEY